MTYQPNYPPQQPPPTYPPSPYQQPSVPPPPVPGQKRFSIFAAYILAPIFSGSLYRDVARNWRGIAFWCLFLLLVVSWLVWSVKFHKYLNKIARDDFPKFAKEVPEVTITGGKLSSSVAQPYELKDPESNKPILVLDTTDKINSMDDTQAQALVTEDKLFVREQTGKITEIPLKAINDVFGNVSLDAKGLQSGADWVARWGATLLYVPALLISLVFRLIQVLIYALVGLAFASMFSARLSFAALMRLAVMAIIPIVIIDTVLYLAGVTIPLWGLLGIGLALLYLAMAVKANAGDQQPTPYPQYGYAPPQPMQPPYQPPAEMPPPPTMPPPPR